jgi:hypothetical protein
MQVENPERAARQNNDHVDPVILSNTHPQRSDFEVEQEQW